MSALRPAGSTRRWRQLRAFILDRDQRRCQVDGCGAYATHVDHLLPRVAGGSDDPANLRAACAPCNLRRGAGLARPQRQGTSVGWRW